MKKNLFIFTLIFLFSFSDGFVPHISKIKTKWINDIFLYINVLDNKINSQINSHYEVKLFSNNFIEIIKLNKKGNSIFVSKNVSKIEVIAY